MGPLDIMIVALQKKVSFIKAPVNAFHSHLYHGCATRGGIDFPSFRDYRIGDDLEFGLDILRSSCNCPSIMVPSLNWVVDKTVKRHLEKLQNIKFLKTNSIRSYPLAMSEVESFTDGFRRPLPPSLLHHEAIDRLGESHPEYDLWEVVVPRADDLDSDNVNCILRWTIHEDGNESELNVTLDALHQCPFIIHEGTCLLDENLYACVSGFINEQYFYVDFIRAV